ncbi:MAG: 3-oxo-tetronate kinase [Veillonellales bacterium]
MSNANDKLLLGCVADDFTGASDAASFLVKEGINTILLNGVLKDVDITSDCSAVVIAMKTRNMEPQSAVSDTRQAFRWLAERGAKQFYIKYCSTFDSRKDGNIGPTIDSTLEDYQEQYTVICPALPVNRRIVKDGKLYVDGVPLDQSHMKSHPLNPMWDSEIAKLMEPQGKYPCLSINKQQLMKPKSEILRYVAKFAEKQQHFYIVPDYITEQDAAKIIEVFGSIKLLTGGSGLLSALGRKYRQDGVLPQEDRITSGTKGRGIVLAGSCSKATLEQINEFIKHGGAAYKIEPSKFLQGQATVEDIWNFVCVNSRHEVLIYSSDTPDVVQENKKLGQEKISALFESLIAEIAKRAVANNITRLVVAGGETAGAVIMGLGLDGFIIGESIAPGVPIMVPLNCKKLRLVLKSGNFGQQDFFQRALDMTRG